MKKYLLYIFITVLAVNANAQDGFERTAKGTQYKMLTHNTGDRIKVGDVVTFNFLQKTSKDSVLYSTYQTGKPAQAQVQSTGDLMDVLPLLTLKDSLMVRIPADTIFKGHEERRPPFLPPGSNLFFILKVEKVQSLTEAMADRDKEIAAAKAEGAKIEAQEAVNADKYIADNKLVVKTTPSGLKYKITKLGTGPKPVAGDTVYVNYLGHTLDGKVFDTSIEAEAKKTGLAQPGRVYEPLHFALGTEGIIAGWNESFPLLNAGSKATLIIPSKLAYKENAAGPGIPPYSTLVFDVELVKVKKGPNAATPVKKAITKSTVKKPAVKKPVATKKKQ
ncbi:MAG: Peptidylprolyl isomerase [Mucilaginibacter sp.]|uniref:FKBP-type peptidyl-prolyl cis-trans isomerase n=1 Tax=Mucilaginibacter sp. TaxID=1882438 RepID=UPI002622C1D2|nr:FKBP-type peptidyl-prolyl cis-trans isomerase [Mucilaginibacter sp.]MDB5005240.1 Peptidylprolyl isomerase [Mucilaginibacter sp.]